jgi:hypothetical protein
MALIDICSAGPAMSSTMPRPFSDIISASATSRRYSALAASSNAHLAAFTPAPLTASNLHSATPTSNLYSTVASNSTPNSYTPTHSSASSAPDATEETYVPASSPSPQPQMQSSKLAAEALWLQTDPNPTQPRIHRASPSSASGAGSVVSPGAPSFIGSSLTGTSDAPPQYCA